MLNTLASYGTVLAWCGLKLMMNGQASRQGIRLPESISSAELGAAESDSAVSDINIIRLGSQDGRQKYRRALLGLVHDCNGQDFVEYALMAGFVAVMAGAVNPAVFHSVGTLFSGITSSLTVAGTQS